MPWHGCGDEDGDLLIVHDRLERRPHGYLSLAVPNIPADQPVHGLRPTHIRLDMLDGRDLIACLVKGKGRLKLALPGGVRSKGVPLGHLSGGIELQELLRHFPDGGPHPLLCPRPRR